DALRRAAVNAIPDVLPKEYNATYQQAQFLTHSKELTAILKPAAERVSKLDSSSTKVREAFHAVLGRAPDADEIAAAAELLAGSSDGVADLLWALMTSAEFLPMP